MGVDVTLVRHAQIDDGAATALTTAALQRCYALGEVLDGCLVNATYCASDQWSQRTVAAMISRSSRLAQAPSATSELLDELMLEPGTVYMSPEWNTGVSVTTAQTESLDMLKRRMAAAVQALILPHVLSGAGAHLVIVGSAVVLNELLQHIFLLNMASVAAPDKPVRPMNMITMPLAPASFHRLEISVDGDVMAVRVLTLGETAHIHEGASVSPLVMSPNVLQSSPAIPSRQASPEDTPRSESRYMSALKIFSSSPHGRARPDGYTPSYLYGRYSRQVDSRSTTPHGSAKALALYDAGTMARSIARLDPASSDPDASDVPDSPSVPLGGFGRSSDVLSLISAPKSSAAPRLNRWNGEAITAASSLVSLPSSMSRASFSIAQQPTAHLLPHQGTLHNVSAFAQNLFGHSSAQAQDDGAERGAMLWNTVCMRILAVFNNETGGTVEDVNDALEKYMYIVFEREQANAVLVLEDELQHVIEIGLISITLQLQGLESADFLWRLAEVWAFYFGTVVPYLHAYLLPLETTAVHLAKEHAASALMTEAVSSDDGTSESMSTNHDDCDVDVDVDDDDDDSDDDDSREPAKRMPLSRPARMPHAYVAPSTIDVRAVLLSAFRDRIIFPIYDWLLGEMHGITGSAALHEHNTVALFQLRAHLCQLTSILTSVATHDEAQRAMELLRDTLVETDSIPHEPIA